MEDKHFDGIYCKCGQYHQFAVSYEEHTDIIRCNCGRVWVITCVEPD